MNMLPTITTLTGAVVISGIGVVYTKHQSRLLYNELIKAEQREIRLQTAWQHLQLEQRTLTAETVIDTRARYQLNMTAPQQQSIIYIRP